MNSLKNFLRKIDFFGVPFSFKYKNKEKYTTAVGGFFVVLFIGAALFLGIYYFIPFYNRKNYTTVYYTLTMSETERISFAESKTGFAIGLNCWTGNDGTTADQLLKVDHYYVYYKLIDNEYKKTMKTIGVHPCTKADFYNEFDETFDGSQLYNYQCLDDPTNAMEGIFTSSIFSYYQFEVNAKNNSQELLDKITDYMIENDCKLQMYYVDNTIDIADYEDPIKSYVEAIFIQLNPTMSIRRNIYFMNEHLYDDNYLFWVFGDDDNARYVKTLFSRYEEYSLYQGVNRAKGSSDYLNFAKVYIRADTKRTDVKRKYQKVMEFYADASSLLIAAFDILIIIFNFINGFWAEQNLAKNIFFFQDLDDNNLKLKYKTDKIKELLFATDLKENKFTGTPDYIEENVNDNMKELDHLKSTYINNKDNNIGKNNTKKKYPVKMGNRENDMKKKYPMKMKNLENEEINIYNAKKSKNFRYQQNVKKFSQKHPWNKRLKESSEVEESEDSNDNYNEKYESSNKPYQSRESGNLNFKSNRNQLQDSNFDSNDNDINIYNVKKYEISSSEDRGLKRKAKNKNKEKIEFSFNIFEVIGVHLCRCCQSKNLRIKNDLNGKANNILYSKLDISNFVRNQLLFDIMNETILDREYIDVINFLSRPNISLYNKEESELSLFYKRYKNKDFNIFYNKLIELTNKPDKQDREKKLILLSNKYLKKFHI